MYIYTFQYININININIDALLGGIYTTSNHWDATLGCNSWALACRWQVDLRKTRALWTCHAIAELPGLAIVATSPRKVGCAAGMTAVRALTLVDVGIDVGSCVLGAVDWGSPKLGYQEHSRNRPAGTSPVGATVSLEAPGWNRS